MSTEPKGLTQQGKIWSAYVAKNISCKEANNPNSLFLTGRTVLDKEAFNRINDTEHDVIHGLQVFYGPFSSKQEAMEFISEYPFEWPGENEWRWVNPGKPEIISSYFDPSKADLVNNASLEFQGQVILQEQERRIKEIEQIQEKIRKREELVLEEKIVPKDNEIDNFVAIADNKISTLEKQLEQVRVHREKLLAMKKGDDDTVTE